MKTVRNSLAFLSGMLLAAIWMLALGGCGGSGKHKSKHQELPPAVSSQPQTPRILPTDVPAGPVELSEPGALWGWLAAAGLLGGLVSIRGRK